MSQSPTLDLKVMICARCAKVLSADEPTTEVSLSESKATTQHTTATTASSEGALEDFESASQVTGPRSLTSAAYKWRDPNVYVTVIYMYITCMYARTYICSVCTVTVQFSGTYVHAILGIKS